MTTGQIDVVMEYSLTSELRESIMYTGQRIVSSEKYTLRWLLRPFYFMHGPMVTGSAVV